MLEIARASWGRDVDWSGLADQAHSLGANHPTLLRESTSTPATSRPPLRKAPSDGGAHPAEDVARMPAPGEDELLEHTIAALRTALRLANLSVATEKTYVAWCSRFVRFCMRRLKHPPAQLGPDAISAYMEFLALERRVAPATETPEESFESSHAPPACRLVRIRLLRMEGEKTWIRHDWRARGRLSAEA